MKNIVLISLVLVLSSCAKYPKFCLDGTEWIGQSQDGNSVLLTFQCSEDNEYGVLFPGANPPIKVKYYCDKTYIYFDYIYKGIPNRSVGYLDREIEHAKILSIPFKDQMVTLTRR